jgi:hypothetical protein
VCTKGQRPAAALFVLVEAPLAFHAADRAFVVASATLPFTVPGSTEVLSNHSFHEVTSTMSGSPAKAASQVAS